jgi:pilus assembly protein CpaB
MNRNRLLMGLALAIVIAFALSAYVYRTFKLATSMPAIATEQIVVASQPLPLGTRLDSSMLRTMSWPVDRPLEGIHKNVQDVVNRTLLIPVAANEPILDGKMAPTSAGAGLAALIPPGMRALSVPVNDVIGVAGFVTPGTMVDVMMTGTIPGATGAGQVITRTILENVRVLAVGQKTDTDRTGKPLTAPVITLLVSPEDAGKLAMASTQGKIQLALRNVLDTDANPPAPILQAALFSPTGTPVAPPVVQHVQTRKAPPPPAPYKVEVITGAKREEKSFTDTAQ